MILGPFYPSLTSTDSGGTGFLSDIQLPFFFGGGGLVGRCAATGEVGAAPLAPLVTGPLEPRWKIVSGGGTGFLLDMLLVFLLWRRRTCWAHDIGRNRLGGAVVTGFDLVRLLWRQSISRILISPQIWFRF